MSSPFEKGGTVHKDETMLHRPGAGEEVVQPGNLPLFGSFPGGIHKDEFGALGDEEKGIRPEVLEKIFLPPVAHLRIAYCYKSWFVQFLQGPIENTILVVPSVDEAVSQKDDKIGLGIVYEGYEPSVENVYRVPHFSHQNEGIAGTVIDFVLDPQYRVAVVVPES
jgi:hypothetical protein